MQTDPLGFAAGDVNLYRYCGNEPVNFTDSSGLLWKKMRNWWNKLWGIKSGDESNPNKAINRLGQAATEMAAGEVKNGIIGYILNRLAGQEMPSAVGGIGSVAEGAVALGEGLQVVIPYARTLDYYRTNDFINSP